MCRSRNLPRRPHLQHTHLNGHLLNPATSRKDTLVFFPVLKQVQPCPIWMPRARSGLFSVISHGLDLHVGSPQRLCSSSLCFNSFNYYLKLTCPLPYLLRDPIIQPSTNSLGDPGTGTRDCHTPALCSVENEFTTINKTCILKRYIFTR